jgi:plasmid maintenance system antidote protein VapI
MPTVTTPTKSAQGETFRLTAKKRLVELGWSVTDLANKVGVSRKAVSIAINHESMSPRMKDRIRKALKLQK